MARGKKTGGKVKGSRNKATIERERQIRAQIAAQMQEEARAKLVAANGNMEKVAAEAAVKVADLAAQGQKPMFELASDFVQLFASMAAHYQRWPPHLGKNPNENEEKCREWAILAFNGAKELTGYQRPKLSAAVVGAVVTNKIEVSGGLPDELDGNLNPASSLELKAEPPKDEEAA